MKLRKTALSLLLIATPHASAFLAPSRAPSPLKVISSSSPKTMTDARHPLTTSPRNGPLQMVFAPLDFVNEGIQLNQLFHMDTWKESLSLMFSQISELPSTLTCAQIRTAGESSFAALFLIAVIQGALITYQYASNPSGELIVPPGLTIGEEDASLETEKNKDLTTKKKISVYRPCELDDASLTELVCDSTDSTFSCSVKKGWYHIYKSLVFLLPLLAGQGSFAVLRYGHLMHMGVVLALARVYDFFRKLPEQIDYVELPEQSAFGEHPNVVVLGDSMSVGIGCVNEFDTEKNSGILRRIEQLEETNADADKTSATGPVFPRALARSLSKRLNKPVGWRSAGVDGGDTNAIREYLLPIIQEEADKGKAPDLVVVLTGSNDLKHIISVDPKNTASLRGFRSNLMALVQDIRRISPKTKVVFPALPTYRLDSNSILNVFPLSLFLDGIIGAWDSQKTHVADKCPGVYHVGLTVQDVNKWYKEEQANGDEAPSLLSADGIHPNAKCYDKWGDYVGKKVADALAVSEEPPSAKNNKRTQNKQHQSRRPAYATASTPLWGM